MRATPHTAHADRYFAVLNAAIGARGRYLLLGDLLRRVAGVIAVAGLFPLAVVAADHAWPGGLPRGVFIGAALAWAALIAGVSSYVLLGTLRRRIHPLFAARSVEVAGHISHNTVINALLLRASPRAAYASAAAARRAAADVSRVAGTQPSALPLGRVPLAALGVVLAAWVLYGAFSPKSPWTSLARLFGADWAAPTATRIDLLRPAGGDVVYAAEPLELAVGIVGRDVDAVWFESRPPTATTTPPRYAMERESNDPDRWRLTLAPHEVAGDLAFRCLAGDASLEGTIAVQPQPELIEMAVDVTPPAYTGMPAEQGVEPDLIVPTGTIARFTIHGNVELHNAVCVFQADSEKRTRLTVAPDDPRRATVELALTESGEYWFEFTDRWGHPAVRPARHRATVHADEPPVVEIVSPSRVQVPDDVVDVTQFAELVARARDDHGLLELVRVRAERGPAERVEVAPTIPASKTRTVTVITGDLVPEPGGRAAVWFEARDTRLRPDGTPAPQTARTRTLTLLRPPDKPDQSKPGAASEQEPPTSGGDGEDPSPSTGDEGQASDEEGAEPDDSQGAPGEPQSRDQSTGTTGNSSATEDGETGSESGSGADEGAADGAEADMERAIQEFLEKHGEEVREARRQLGNQSTDEPTPDERDAASKPGAGDASTGEARTNDPDQAAAAASAAEGRSGEPAGDEPAMSGQTGDRESDGGSSNKSQPIDNAGGDTAGENTEMTQGESGQSGSGTAGAPKAETEDASSGSTAESPAEPGSSGEPPASDGEAAETSTAKGESGKGPGPTSGNGQAGTGGDVGQSEPANTDGDGSGATEPGGPEPGPAGGSGDQPPGDDAGAPGSTGGGGGEPGDRDPSGSPRRTSDAGGEASRAAGGPLDSTGRAELVDLLGMLERGGEPEEQALAELDWPTERSEAFTRDLRRLRELIDRANADPATRRPFDLTAPGEARVQAGAGLSPEVTTATDPAARRRDALGKIVPPAEQHVSPELQALLEAYYRSLARQGDGGSNAP